MEPLDDVAFSQLLKYMPDQALTRLSIASTDTHDVVKKHTGESHWLEKLSDKLGVMLLPGNIPKETTAEEIYKDLYNTDSRRATAPTRPVAVYLTGTATQADIDIVLQNASHYGMPSLIKVLLNDKRVKFAADKQAAVNRAATEGHADVVRLLLTNKRVNPAAYGNKAIQNAASLGHFDVVLLLLKDSRVDPSVNNNAVIKGAASTGNPELVRALLNDKRVDPSGEGNQALKLAVSSGNAEVVKLLLNHPKVRSSKVYAQSLSENAITSDDSDVLEVILTDPVLGRSVDRGALLDQAAFYGAVKSLKLLLSDSKSDPSRNDIVEILRGDPRVTY